MADDLGEQMANEQEKEVTFFLGGACNSNCIMCPSTERERKTVLHNTEKRIMEQIESLPTDIPYYTVTGGEPTMDPEMFLRVMAKLADSFPGASAQLLTNGRSFSSRVFLKKLLIKCPPDMVVAIPLHGATAELHDAITRAKGSFDQTVKGLENLSAEKIAIEIRIVVTRLNADFVYDIADFIVKHFPSVYVVNFIGLEVRGNCYKNMSSVYISPVESFEKSKRAIDLLVRNGIDVGLYNYPLCAVERRYWFICKRSISPDKVRFGECCSACQCRSICGGLFATTLVIAKPKLSAIKV